MPDVTQSKYFIISSKIPQPDLAFFLFVVYLSDFLMGCKFPKDKTMSSMTLSLWYLTQGPAHSPLLCFMIFHAPDYSLWNVSSLPMTFSKCDFQN